MCSETITGVFLTISVYYSQQFLKRQRRLKEGDQNDEKWDDIDETINKFNQKVKDSGRPEQGNERVSGLNIMTSHEIFLL